MKRASIPCIDPYPKKGSIWFDLGGLAIFKSTLCAQCLLLATTMNHSNRPITLTIFASFLILVGLITLGTNLRREHLPGFVPDASAITFWTMTLDACVLIVCGIGILLRRSVARVLLISVQLVTAGVIACFGGVPLAPLILGIASYFLLFTGVGKLWFEGESK